MKNLTLYTVLLLLPFSAGIPQNTNSGIMKDQMVLITGGDFIPLYQENNEAQKVNDFYIDVYPVTNGQFVEFIKANPKWRRTEVKKIFADKNYLIQWESDTVPGPEVNLNSPVTNISWFAAKAYAEWKGKRLPTVAEWEYTAAAGKNKKNAANDPENIKRIQQWYSKLNSRELSSVGSTEKNYWGVYDLFGLIWEWTFDFNSALVTGESRGGGNTEKNLFCGSGSSSVQDAGNYPAFMRYGFRSSLKANYTVSNLGFRCAKDINKKKES